jgi:hypothetical protein
MAARVKDGTAVTANGDVLIGLWLAPASLDRWNWHVAALDELAARNGSSVLYFDIILESSSPPDARLRAAMRADLQRIGPKLRKLIAVPIGDGFWHAVVRTVVRGLLLLSGQSKLQTVQATISEGLDRVRELASQDTPTREALEADIDELFGKLGVERSASIICSS